MTRVVIHNHLPARDTLPMNSTGKYASDWSQVMSELRARRPRPVNKLWNNPSNAPPEQVAAAEQKIREWNREYSRASKMQKKALEEDNENFRRSQGRDADPTVEGKITAGLQALRSRYQALHAERISYEKKARKLGSSSSSSEAAAAWGFANKVAQAEGDALSAYNLAVDQAKQLGVRSFSKIQSGSTR
jgi:hypothetical protein